MSKTKYSYAVDLCCEINSDKDDFDKLTKEELIFGFIGRLHSLTKNWDREAFGLCDTYAYEVTQEDQTDATVEQAYHQLVATIGQEEADLINAYIELKIEQELQNHEKKRPDYPLNQRFTGR